MREQGRDCSMEGRRTPIDLTPEEFSEMGHRLVDDITELLAGMRESPLATGETPEKVRGLLDVSAGAA